MREIIVLMCMLTVAGATKAGTRPDPDGAIQAFLDLKAAVLEGRAEDAWEMLSSDLKQVAGTKEAWIRRFRYVPGISQIESMNPLRTEAHGDVVSVIMSDAGPNRLRVNFVFENGGWKLSGSEHGHEPPYPPGHEEEFGDAAASFARALCDLYRVGEMCAQAEQLAAWAPNVIADADVVRVQSGLAEAYQVAMRYRDVFRAARRNGDLAASRPSLETLRQEIEEAVAALREATEALLEALRSSPYLASNVTGVSDVAPIGNPVAKNGLGSRLQFGFVGRFWESHAWKSARLLDFDFVQFDVGWAEVKVDVLPDGTHDFSGLDRLIEHAAEFGWQTDIGQANLGNLQFNHWDPDVVASQERYFRSLGGHYSDNPHVICYEIFNEPDVYLCEKDDPESTHVRNAFTEYLLREFGTLNAVNAALGTNYASIQDIDFPMAEPSDDFTPLTYEFARFNQQSLADFLWTCTEELQQADPNHPALTQITEFGGKQDAFLIGSGPPDVFSVHMTFGGPHGGDNNMVQAYSLAKVLGKPLWQEEFIFNYPEAADSSGMLKTNPVVVAAAIERNIWQAAAWGFSGMLFFELDNFWPGWNDHMLEPDDLYGLLTPSSAIIPAVLEKVRTVDPVLRGTKIVTPQIAILDCPTTRLLAGRRDAARMTTTSLERLLSQRHWPYLMVPEGGLDRPSAELDAYKVILLPSTTHIRADAARTLAAWARNGGKLVVVGAQSVKDHYGRESELMGLDPGQLRFVDPGETATSVLEDLSACAEIRKPAWFEGPGQVELVLREDAGGRRYLVAINLDARAEALGHLAFGAGCSRVTNLCAGVTARTSYTANVSRLALRLAPGRGVLLALEMTNPHDMSCPVNTNASAGSPAVTSR